MAWKDILDNDIDTESPIVDEAVDKSSLWRMRDNITAMFTGLANAPRISGEAFADSSIIGTRIGALAITADKWLDQSIGSIAIGANAVRQSTLDTTVSTILLDGQHVTDGGATGGGTSASGFWKMAQNPGGAEMLGYRSWMQNANTNDFHRITFPGVAAQTNNSNRDTVMVDRIQTARGWVYLSGTTASTWINQLVICEIRHVTASPPYDLGQGEIPLFLFMQLGGAHHGPGIIWSSVDPPWASGGATRIHPNVVRNGKSYLRKLRLPHTVADAVLNDKKMEALIDALSRPPVYDEIEITTKYKNSDMPRVPHPFGRIPSTDQVVMLDPLSRIAEDLRDLQAAGENVGSLIASDYIRLADRVHGVMTPPGIDAVGLEWRNTKGSA